ncbi:DUF58 domain-containing protein [Fervidibacillus halotolerans]|uniref:DUF58 domain-containing protein n=1 Tax=Fervidibacillus halotolerans TaxID=2980027 RepID=A0A9E8M0B7_9BACI|nr:DUF58 domain-containing protein [Fervidibacillus halotolerans]WAA12590.1 DUF58 domain-containing protein [Fervidibacillus halotolerans]
MSKRTKNFFQFFLLLVFLFASFSYAMFQGGFVSWFLFAAFCPIALYSLLIRSIPMKNWSVQRTLTHQEYQAGETLVVELQFQRPNAFPLLFLIIEEEISEKFILRTGQSLKFMAHPLFKKTFTFRYTVESLPRGEYEFSSVKLKTGDLFGFITQETRFKQVNRFFVYPSYVEMVYEPLESKFEMGKTATKDKVQRDTTMAISVREYQQGDRFSWIHWKASARKNDILTKEFEQRQSHDILIVMDCSESIDFELLVTFAASAVRAIIKKGAQVGFISHGKQRDYFPIRGGEPHLRKLFYHLASVEDNQSIPFSRVIEMEKISLLKNQLVLFITTKCTKEVIDQIGSLLSRKVSPVLFIVKSQSNKLTAEEQSLVDLARQRGILAKTIYEGEFVRSFVRGTW